MCVEKINNSGCNIRITFADDSHIYATWEINPDIKKPPFKVITLDNQAKHLYKDPLAHVIVSAALLRFAAKIVNSGT